MRASVALIALVAPAAAQTLSADESGRVMGAFDGIDQIAEKKPDLWPGFDLAAIPIAVYQPGRSMLLVGHPKPPVGRQYKTHGRVAIWAPAAGECWGVAWATVQGHRTACVEMRELLESKQPVRLLAAAAFAAFAGERIAAPTLEDRLAYDEDDAANNGAIELEQRVLDEVIAGDSAGIADRAREWLGVRAARLARLPPRARKFELQVERSTLTAYVAARALLGTPVDAEGADGRLGRLVVGIGRLLDAVRPGWRDEAFGRIAALEDLVRLSVKGETRKAAEAARLRLAWPLLLDAAERRSMMAGRERAVLWSQVEAAGGIGVIAVELPAPLPEGARRVDARGLRRIDGGRRVWITPVRLDLGARGTLLFWRPVAESLAKNRFAARMPAGLRIMVDDREIPLGAPLKSAFGRFEVEGEGLRWAIEGGSIDVKNGGVVVHPRGLKD